MILIICMHAQTDFIDKKAASLMFVLFNFMAVQEEKRTGKKKREREKAAAAETKVDSFKVEPFV